jgi:hypothetical protein
MRAAGGHRQNSRADRSHDRRVAGQHAEITFDARNVHLVDFARESELFRRDEIEVEGGHDLSVLSAVTRGLDPRVHQQKLLWRWIAGSSL